MRHPRLLAVALLALSFIIPACSDTDKPTQLTSPGDALHDGVLGVLNVCPTAYDFDMDPEDAINEDATKASIHPFVSEGEHGEVDVLTITQQPHHGFAQVSNDYILYTPTDNYCGLDTMQYKASNGTCDSNPAFIYIIVACENDCPTSRSDVANALSGTPTSIDLDANDVDGSPSGVFIVTSPAHGVLSPGGTVLSVVYTSIAGYVGPDSFQWAATDGTCNSATATVSINVQSPVVDDDGDGVPNDDDDCDNSIVGGTIVIDGCDSGVANAIGEGAADVSGCTLADKIGADVAAASQSAKNHGKFVSSMAQRLNTMVRDGLITGAQKDALMSCIGSSSLNKTN
jgi:hypothetical protein